MNWLEVTLVVNGELAEAVADVLARFAYSGVMMEQGVKYNDEEDAGTPTGPITVRAYLEMDDQIEEKTAETRRVPVLSGDDPAAARCHLQADRRSKLDGSLEAALQADPDRRAARHRPRLDGSHRIRAGLPSRSIPAWRLARGRIPPRSYVWN